MEKEQHKCMQTENIQLINRALFGDEKLGELGMLKKIDEMYDFYVAGNLLRKFAIKGFIAISAIAGLIYTFIKIDADRRR